MLQVRFLAGAQKETPSAFAGGVSFRIKAVHGILSGMQRMGIDFGSKKIGIALSDESGVMAFPHSVIPNDSQYLKTIEAIITERKVQEIVIGHSLKLDGSPNKIQSSIEECMMDLTLSTGLPIHLEPEQFSSQEAARITGKNQHIDASAAAIILNSFIEKQKNI